MYSAKKKLFLLIYFNFANALNELEDLCVKL